MSWESMVIIGIVIAFEIAGAAAFGLLISGVFINDDDDDDD